MKIRNFGIFALLISLVRGISTAHADIQWETDYNTARAKAATYNEPLFIDFYTDWCGWCKKLDSDVYPDPRVQSAASNVVMLKLNAEGSGQSLAKRLGVTGYPSMFFFNSRGQTLTNIPGYTTPDQVAMTLRAAVRANGGSHSTAAPPLSAARTAPRTSAVTRSAPLPSDWRQIPELRNASVAKGFSGVYLLDENGITPLDKKPVAKKMGTKKVAAVHKKRVVYRKKHK